MARDERAGSFVLGTTALDAEIGSELGQLCERAVARYSDRLRAVVLTGSLARREGVVVRDGDALRLLSDIDVYCVLESSHPPRPEHAGAEALLPQTMPSWLRAAFDLAIVGHDYFEALGPTLPAAQLNHAFRILHLRAGAPPVLPLRQSPTSVDPDDATLLLLNRCAELLPVRRQADALMAGYRAWKLAVDAPFAFLAAFGDLELTRDGQLKRLEQMALNWDEPSRAWLARGVESLRRWRARCGRAGLEASELVEGGEELGRWAFDWARPFLAACVEGACRGGDGAALLQSCIQARESALSDDRGDRWLRRRGAWETLRQARRWAPLAPSGLRHWLRYGTGGIGPERLFWGILQLLDGRSPTAATPLFGAAAPGSDLAEWSYRLRESWQGWMRGEHRT